MRKVLTINQTLGPAILVSDLLHKSRDVVCKQAFHNNTWVGHKWAELGLFLFLCLLFVVDVEVLEFVAGSSVGNLSSNEKNADVKTPLHSRPRPPHTKMLSRKPSDRR